MSANLVVALVIPWLFWGTVIGLLIAGGRSWINILLIPAVFTVVILLIARFASDQEAFWSSLILHIFLLVFFVGSYVSFVLRQRKKNG